MTPCLPKVSDLGGAGHSGRAGLSRNWPKPPAPEKPRRVPTGGSGAYKGVRSTATSSLPGGEAGLDRMGSGAAGHHGQASPLQVVFPECSARAPGPPGPSDPCANTLASAGGAGAGSVRAWPRRGDPALRGDFMSQRERCFQREQSLSKGRETQPDW